MKLAFNENNIMAGQEWVGYAMFVLNLILLVWVRHTFHTQYVYIATFVLGAVVSNLICMKVWGDTEFFEWDKKEMLRSKKFIIRYMLFCTYFSYLLVFYLASIADDIYIGMYWELAVDCFMVLFYGFNLINIPSIYYSVFEDVLQLPRDLKKKPDNWD